MNRFASLFALFVCMPTGSAAARNSQAVKVSRAEYGGVRMSLSIPNRTYPRNALVRATVQIENGSRFDVGIQRMGCVADGLSPQVQVLDGRNRVRFPPALPPPPTGTCLGGQPPALQPGSTTTLRYLLILAGSRLRAVARLDFSAGGPVPPPLLKTPPLKLALGPKHPPRITVKSTGGRISALLVYPGRQRGDAFYFTDWHRCAADNSFVVSGNSFQLSPRAESGTPPAIVGRVGAWTRSRTQRLAPPCDHTEAWHLAVARLNHSVGWVNYLAP